MITCAVNLVLTAVAEKQKLPDSKTYIQQKHSGFSEPSCSCTMNQEQLAKMNVVGDGGGAERRRDIGVFRSKDYLCQKCGKGFGSLKAVHGHMKVHSTRSRALREESVQEITYPVPKKRSTMGIKIGSAVASFSTSAKSQPVVSEFDEVEEAAATSLMMLSQGARSCNDEISFESETTPCNEEIPRNEDDEKKTESELFVGRFIRIDQFKKFNVKMGGEFSESKPPKVEVCMQLENSYPISMKTGIANSEVKKEIYSSYKETGMITDDEDNKALGGQKRIRCPGFMKSQVKKESVHTNPLELGSTEDVIVFSNSTGGKCKEHECPVCFKVFASGRALGGHKIIHSPDFMKSQVKKECVNNANPLEKRSTEDVIAFPTSTGSKCREHVCSVCFKVFASGQALGSHKRTHYTGFMKRKVKKESLPEILDPP